jgi:Fic-DOC domain mobile mystery protein B/predicted DNA-binding mobile mystery protein A
MKRKFKDLRLKQLRDTLDWAAQIKDLRVPSAGWIKAIRTALGMPQSFLARRLKVSAAAVAQYETAEREGTITISTLRKVADGLDCEFVYAIIPRTSLDAIREQRARDVAWKTVRSVSQTMALEEQSLTKDEEYERARELARQILQEHSRKMWSHD